ncbi:MAG TPA: hypothetical protein VFT27_03395 [Actinomycetota bacterium]|nr:hypothetical protein [Actinomycetota bacterium]
MRAYLEELEREAMLGARSMGASSADMADALGITRQGVHQKLKRLAPTSSSRVGPDSDRIVLPELEPEPD